MTFAHPSILWALFALAIPIIVHLFDFRRYKKLHFSDNYFLQELTNKNKKQRQLRKFIILCLRMLFIASIVIAFAKPYLRKDSGSAVVNQFDYVTIYIDNSFSMEIEDGKTNRLEMAREKAKSIVNAYKFGMNFRLVTNDFLSENERLLSREECLEMINNIDFCAFPRSIGSVLSHIENISEQDYSNKSSQCYIISDFQKSTSDFKNIVHTKNKLFLFPIETQHVSNISVDSVWFDTPMQIEDKVLVIKAKIKNYTEIPIEKIPVRFYLNGKQKGLSTVELTAGGSDIVSFSFTVNEGATHEGYIEIDDSPLNFDDRIYFAFNIEKSIPIYHVSGANSTNVVQNLFDSDSLFDYKKANESNIDVGQLASGRLVVLDEVSDISTGVANELKRKVEKGDNVLVIPNANDPSGYKNFFDMLSIPFYMGKDTSKTRIAAINYEHPLLNGVFATVPKQIQFPNVFRHYRMSSSKGSNILSLLDGSPFLAEYTIGNGRVYVLSASLNPSFSNFANNAIVVPVFMQMAFYRNNQTAISYSLDFPRGIEIPDDENVLEKPPVLKSFDSKTEIIPYFSSGSSPKIFLNSQVNIAGAYKLVRGDKTLSSFGLNYPRIESNVECFSLEEISSFVKSNKNIEVLKTETNSSDLMAIAQEKVKIWKIFIIFALLFFATELILLRIWV